MNTGMIVHSAVALLMAFHLFFGGLVLDTMAGINGGAELFFAYRVATLCILSAACLWLVITSNGLRLSAFAWLLAALVPFGFVIGLIHGVGITGGALSHAIQAVTALLGFTTGWLFTRQGLDLMMVFRRAGYALFGIVAFLVLTYFFWIWLNDYKIRHYSLDFFGLVFPFAYFLTARRLWWALATFLIMLLVGKRAIPIAGLAMFAWWFIEARGGFRAVLSFRRSDALAIASVAVVFFGWFVAMAQLGTAPLPSVAAQVEESGVVLTPHSENYMVERYTNFSDLNKLSSMRGDMISSVVDLMNSRPLQWWTGAGFGSSYVFSHSDGAVQVKMWGVDVMPAHLVMLYGVPVAMLILGYIAWVMLRGWIAVHRAPSSDDRSAKVALVAVLIGYMVCSMFTYASVDPTFWFFLGAAAYLFGPVTVASSRPSRA